MVEDKEVAGFITPVNGNDLNYWPTQKWDDFLHEGLTNKFDFSNESPAKYKKRDLISVIIDLCGVQSIAWEG